MTKKLLWKVDFTFLDCKNANPENFNDKFKAWLKQLQIYYFKLSITIFLLFLFFSIFSFFSLSNIFASLIVFKKISFEYLFIFRKNFDLNTFFYLLWKFLFMIIIFLFINMFLIIKVIQIFIIKKNINKVTMIKAVNIFCQTKILPQNFSQRKKITRLSLLLINITLILICAISLPFPNSLIKYEIDDLSYKEMIDKIQRIK